MEVAEKFIDIKKVIHGKNPRLSEILPGFVIGFIKRLIHQDEVNRIIYTYRDRHGLEFVRCVLEDMKVTYSVKGLENIPRNGRYIFASNHPLGGFDGLVLMDAIGEVFPKVRFIVNDILLNLKNFAPLFVPVNKHGRQSAEYARRIDESYSGDFQILNFPSGLCSRKIKGNITDLKWNKNFIQKAVRYRRDVVPVYFTGRNSNFFYGLANLRKFFRIRLNVEMIFLVDEFFRQKGKHFQLTFGEPVSCTLFDTPKHYSLWAEDIRQRAYALRDR
ncbi:MAG: 1-acyl-sn-glycerol-3-phosphate acyltransferase [Bacteroidales bacterium]|nr:1-acyl-sn-glycerol-3-phosphate acyltransferase [Bacteroidales bacterium]